MFYFMLMSVFYLKCDFFFLCSFVPYSFIFENESNFFNKFQRSSATSSKFEMLALLCILV